MVTRRDFFRGAWLKDLADKPVEKVPQADPYFASFSNCYALLSEIPLEELLETARARGVETADKSKLELVRELFVGSGGA